ncbi:MAG TPA: Clp protease N-terminal domain-containing protein [Solirubrobacteraceae bacterium]
MFERFDADARRVVVRAAYEEAQALGSASLEGEHLLLALAADPSTGAGGLLVDSGLDHDGLVAALERETERSLAAVGIALSDYEPAARPAAGRRKASFATSSKRALARAVGVASARGDRVVSTAHLLVGILRGEIGTVPRALEAVGVDRVTLMIAAERLL